jgi:hypothetical protein
LYAEASVTEVTEGVSELEVGWVEEMVALVAESKDMLGLIIMSIPHWFVIGVEAVEEKEVTDENAALKLNTSDWGLTVSFSREVPGVLVPDPVTDETNGFWSVT